MGKRHRAQDPDDPSSLPLLSSSAHHSSPPSVVANYNKDRAHAASNPKKHHHAHALPPNGLLADRPDSQPHSEHKTKKKKIKEATAQFEPSIKAADSTRLRETPKKSSEQFANKVILDGEGDENNGAKRKAQRDERAKAEDGALVEASNRETPKKKSGKHDRARDKSNSFEKRSKKPDGDDFAKLSSDAQLSGSVPSSVEVKARTEKGSAAEPAGLEIYWKLSSTNAVTREAASVALVRELQAAQQAFEESGDDDQNEADHLLLGAGRDSDGLEGCAPGVRYAVRRLVRGVASSHESARHGFALALTMVLGVLPCVKGIAIMRIIEKNLDIPSIAKRQEAREALLGRLFAFASMVQSKRIFSDGNGCDEELSKEVTNHLLALAQEKSFLCEPAVCVLLELADQLTNDSLENSICSAPAFKEWIMAGPQSGGVDVVYLAVKLWQRVPAVMGEVCPLLPKSGNLWELFDDSHIQTILPYLEEASFCHPRVHSVWPMLFQMLLPNNIDSTFTSAYSEEENEHKKSSKEALARFWRIVVEGHLLASSHARKHLALNLLMLILPRLPTLYLPIVLSKKFVRCLVDVLSSKDTLLFSCSQFCIQALSKWAEKDNERILGLIMSLQQGSLGKFDIVSRTDTVKSLIKAITNGAGFERLIYRLESMYYSVNSTYAEAEADFAESSPESGKTTVKANGGEEEAEEENSFAEKDILTNRLWMLELMYILCKQVQFDVAQKVALQIEIGKFLFLQVIFDSGVLDKVSPKKLCKVVRWPRQPLPKLLRDACVGHLLRLLVENHRLLEVHYWNKKQSGGRDERSQEDKELGFCLFTFYQELRLLQPVSIPTSLSEDEAEVVSKLTTAILDISSAMETVEEGRFEKLRSVRLLLVQMVLESLLKPGLGTDIALELLLCCKYAFGDILKLSLGDIEGNAAEKPPVIEVIIDIVVSLMADPSGALRRAAEQVFKCFSADVTAASLTGMLQVIMKQPMSARHKLNNPLVDEDNDDDLLGLEEEVSEEEDEQASSSDSEKSQDSSDDLPLNNTSKLSVGSRKDTNRVKNIHKNEIFDTHKIVDQGTLEDGMDSDGSDLPDLDDDAMFRFDSHFAQIFKQRKKGIADGSAERKDADTQLLELKFRALALLEIFLQKCLTNPLVLDIVPPLLQAFVVASATENVHLADRVASILQKKVFKAKYYPKGPGIDLDTVTSKLEVVWRFASRSGNKKIALLAQACWIWFLKVIHGISAAGANNAIVGTVSAALEDFFHQKRSHLSTSFFVEIFSRQNWIGKHLLGRLIEKSVAAPSEFHRCEAMKLAALVLGPKSRMLKETGSFLDGWRPMAEPLHKYIETVGGLMITLFEKPFKKASRQTEALNLCVLFCEFFPLLYSKTLDELFEIEHLLSAVKSFRPPDKGKLRNLVSQFQSSLESRLVSSSITRKNLKAMHAKCLLGESTQRTSLPAGEQSEPLAKHKRNKKEATKRPKLKFEGLETKSWNT